MNRREFLKRTGATVGCAAAGLAAGGGGAAAAGAPGGVSIVCDPADLVASAGPVRWAVAQLQESLAARGVAVRLQRQIRDAGADETCIVVAGHKSPTAADILSRASVSVPDAPESLGLVPAQAGGRAVLLACGSDARGLVYALLELADRIACGGDLAAALGGERPIVERPANVVRSVMRVFASEVEDKSWFNDKAFWRQYLTMLAANRFNRFSLTLGLGYDFPRGLRDTYFHFAYPFLVAVPGRNVRAVGLPDAERDRNIDMLRFISEETAARGLHFQLGLWTHAYEWTDSPNVNYTIEGLARADHVAYCRDALAAVLAACPAVGGVTFRIHGESGVPEGSYDFWKTDFDGAVRCGRRIEIDMHAKGMDQQMIDVALATGLPVVVSPKYWAEHMGLPYHQAAIRPTELPRQRKDEGFFSRSGGSRSFLRYGYGDLLVEGRRYGVLHRMWPGTQRLLLWGDPVMAAAYGRASSLCGSIGMELFEPLSFKGRKGSGLAGGRDAYADEPLRSGPGGADKYLYPYRIWGRLLYNPDADSDVWRRFHRGPCGPGAEALQDALAHAGRILPLITTAHTPSAANNNYWPEMYTNMPIVDASRRHPYGDTPSPKRFGTVSPLDPELFARVDDFAEGLLKGDSGGKYSPVEVAAWLEDLAGAAGRRLAEAETKVADRKRPDYRRTAADIAIQIGLGRFFAGKFRAAVLYAIFDRTAAAAALREAVKAYRAARDAWAGLAALAKGIYMSDVTFGVDAHMRGHWLDRLPAIGQDIADMESRLAKAGAEAPSGKAAPQAVADAIRAALGRPERPAFGVKHQPPDAMHRGRPLQVEATLAAAGQAQGVTARLHYRRMNQAEAWQVADMQGQGNRFTAAIPAEYADSPFPLQYYFGLRDASGRVQLIPGFESDLSGEPYYVVRQA